MTRFVLPIFGALLWVAALATGAGAAVAPPPADVIISPGDVITITVVGEPDLTRHVTVTSDGMIPMAFVGQIKVSGMQPAQAAARISKALSRYVRDPEVSVDLEEANRASIYGRVVRPGIYVLPMRARVMDLVQIAGGFAEGADRANIRLLRHRETIAVDLDKFSSSGDARLNPEVRAGDVLNVPERATIPVSVFGQVMTPGTIAAPVDATVMDAVQMAGGFSERARRDRVLLQRNSGQSLVNLARYETSTQAGDNPRLQAGDTITVPEKRLLAISVLGQVVKPSVYQVPEGTTVAEAIVLSGGLMEGADLSLARLLHRDQQAEALNLRDALENANVAANIVLLDGDTISIPKPVIERRFGVLGAVAAGGYFPMDRDQVTVVEALSRAGGPARDANLNRAIIIRRVGDQTTRSTVDIQKVLNGNRNEQITMLGPGDVLYIQPRSALYSLSTFSGIIGALTAVIYAVR